MALSATLYRFNIDLSDVDRSVYAQFEVRAAQHPSETMPYLLTRLIAYCLSYEEGIAFSRGLSAAEEPAVWVKDLQGNTQAWIEVGTPAPERLHKAAKAVSRVSIFTHHNIDLLKKNFRGKHVHRLDEIEVHVVETAFLNALEAVIDRSNTWSIARNDGEIYVTANDQTITTRLTLHTLAGDAT